MKLWIPFLSLALVASCKDDAVKPAPTSPTAAGSVAPKAGGAKPADSASKPSDAVAAVEFQETDFADERSEPRPVSLLRQDFRGRGQNPRSNRSETSFSTSTRSMS